MNASDARRKVKPTLVYVHCEMWWPLEDGPVCPEDISTRLARKRRVWICGEIAFLSRKAFLEHEEGYCDANY